MLKIYTDLTVAPKGVPFADILKPFLGDQMKNSQDPDSSRWDEFLAEAPKYLQLVGTPEESDIIVTPVQLEHPIYRPREYDWLPMVQWGEKMVATGKPLLGILVADFENPVGDGRSIIYRTSGSLLWRKNYEYCYPAQVVDLLQGQDAEKVIEEGPRDLTVSFCGYVSDARKEPVDLLKGQTEVKFNLIEREKFYGFEDRARLKHLRDEYSANMLGCLYTLCARGGGNFSYRLFEAMSAGRIPLYIDTGGLLPLPKIIPWKKLMVWVSPGQSPAEVLKKFHAEHTSEELLALQKEIRKTWKELLSPCGFHCRGLAQELRHYGVIKE